MVTLPTANECRQALLGDPPPEAAAILAAVEGHILAALGRKQWGCLCPELAYPLDDSGCDVAVLWARRALAAQGYFLRPDDDDAAVSLYWVDPWNP